MKELIIKTIEDHKRVLSLIDDDLIFNLLKIKDNLTRSFRSGNKLIIFGNGGSAADAQHIAAEFLCRFKLERKPLPAIALHTNTSAITAIANDYEFNAIFVRQIEAYAKSGDLALGITTSGKSENVLRGLQVAKNFGCFTAAFLGEYVSDINKIVDIPINIPSFDTARIQEMHILFGHILCDLVEKELFENKN